MTPAPAFVVGQEIPARVFRVDGANMRIFALLMRDPNPIHFDAGYVKAHALGERPVNQGTINLAYLMNALLDQVARPEQLRAFRCRFLANVYEGDEVRAGGTVSGIDGPRVLIDVWLERSDRQRVLEGTAELLLQSA